MVGTASFLFLSSEVVCVPRAPPIGAGGTGATTSTARPLQRCLGAGVAATELAREVGQARTHKRLGYLDGPKRSKGCPDQGRSGLRRLSGATVQASSRTNVSLRSARPMVSASR